MSPAPADPGLPSRLGYAMRRQLARERYYGACIGCLGMYLGSGNVSTLKSRSERLDIEGGPGMGDTSSPVHCLDSEVIT